MFVIDKTIITNYRRIQKIESATINAKRFLKRKRKLQIEFTSQRL